MPTYEEHIEGLTQIDITATSSPSTDDLTEILKNAVISTVNNVTVLKPEELSKFTSTTNHTAYVTKVGRILAVAREHDSTSILRPATPINPSLRYEATDKDSLYYRSKFNPGFYELDGKIYVVPAAGGSDNDIVVTQVSYDTGITASDNYLSGAVDNFPSDCEPSLGLYASAMICNAKAIEINNNMPTAPDVPVAPDFIKDNPLLPELPIFIPQNFEGNLLGVTAAIGREDFELADKQLSLYDKTISSYDKKYEADTAVYQKDLEIFKSELEKESKDADRVSQIEATEYRSELDRYGSEIEFFKSDLQEKLAQYKWYTAQYVTFMSQYNMSLGIKPKAKKEQKQPRKDSDYGDK